jgi:hypothetical protein
MAKVVTKWLKKPWELVKRASLRVKSLFVKESSHQTGKRDIDFRNILILFGLFILTFIAVVLSLPTQDSVKFREVTKNINEARENQQKDKPPGPGSTNLWASPSGFRSGSQGTGVNQNTPMQVLPHNGNSKLELHAGVHLRIQIVDKFIASNEPVPVLGRVLENATSESGLAISEGALLYGEATYQKSSGRAAIKFRKVSYPSGEIRIISANVVSSDGMPGIAGIVHSDAVKNSAGQFISTFVGAVASGSVRRDFMGNSQGGLENGLLVGASEVAKDRAQKYAENLKETREWIEVGSGTQCEAIIEQPFKMIESEVNP